MKKIKLVFVFVSATLLLAGVGKANLFDDFKTTFQDQYLKPFARDIGGLIGLSDFHTGQTVGFPGFDVALYGNMQFEPETDNQILRQSDVEIFGVPMLSATLGLPYNIEVVARGMGYSGVTLFGGGLRYGLFQSKKFSFLPAIKIGAFYDVLDHDYLKITHMSASISASLNLPIIKPYAGIGYDQTELEAKIDSIVDPTVLSGVKVTTHEPRFTAGANLHLLPLLYVFGAYSWLHGVNGFQLGAGLRF